MASLKPTQLETLRLIRRHPARTLAELAKLMDIPLSSMGGRLMKLRNAKLVMRCGVAAEARGAMTFALTDAGEAELAKANEVVAR
jgi:DNA-binding MarR family transcriptional regulator